MNMEPKHFVAKQNFNQQEWACISRHMWQMLDALNHEQVIPAFKLSCLLMRDFTYYGVDMRTFLPPVLLAKCQGTLCGSTIYYYKGKWHIFLRIKPPDKNAGKSISSSIEV